MSDGENLAPKPDEVSALILAAGEGRRMGDRPKAFLEADGVTLLERVVATVKPFSTEIIVGLRSEDIDRGRRLLAGPDIAVTTGGATRHETVINLLQGATRPLALIHEVARPFAPPELFAAILAAGKNYGAATLYLPESPRDSLAIRDGDAFEAPLPRDRVIRTQTPQAFRREILLDAGRQAREKAWVEPSSTEALVAQAGYRVHLVLGMPDNIKLTYPEDWQVAWARLSN